MRFGKLLGVGVVLLGLALTAHAQPKIEVASPEFNFGRIAQHAVVSHTFWIKSVGTEDLVISKIVPGCGCTQAPLSDSTIAPGDSTALEIIFSTKSFRGYVSKRPYMESNAGNLTYVRIDSELLPEPEKAMPVSLSPARLDVSQFTPTPRRTAKFLIQNKSDKDYDIKLVDHAADFFDLELPSSVKAGQTAEGVVTVAESKVETAFEKSLTIDLIGEEDDFRYTLPVKRMYRVQSRATNAPGF